MYIAFVNQDPVNDIELGVALKGLFTSGRQRTLDIDKMVRRTLYTIYK